MPASPAFADDIPVQCASHATATALDADSAVVLDLNSQTYYELNKAGYVIWSYLQEHETATTLELAEALCAHANKARTNKARTNKAHASKAHANDERRDAVLSPDAARAHTNTFLQSMCAAQLIVPAS